ncbi:dTMP kinase [Streptomyces microflavus]|uniref:dTMP kinase n=1 Tax=Streptomyces microflavus TaxID=1919 RepID=UPI003821C0E8
MFVAIEGVDGAGKSTLRRLLAERLSARGHVHLVGQNSWLDVGAARAISGVKFARAGRTVAGVTDYRTDKTLHYRLNIEPALAHGTVIADRYVLSDVVYRSVLEGRDTQILLDSLLDEVLPLPAVTLYLDIDPELAWQRVLHRAKPLRPYETAQNLRALSEAFRTIGPQIPGFRPLVVGESDMAEEVAERAERLVTA